jgi:D-alanyl-D-alanine dipeptidase
MSLLPLPATAPRLRLLTPDSHDIDIDLVYATDLNLTGKIIYRQAHCLLLEPACSGLEKAIALAAGMGLRIKVFDGYRPPEAQQALWDFLPDPTFIADPRKGSNHARGVAIDLTLIDAAGNELDMGTGFDEAVAESAHHHPNVTAGAQRNRMLLLGTMLAAGFTANPNEWWHYQLPNPTQYALLADGADGVPRMMS